MRTLVLVLAVAACGATHHRKTMVDDFTKNGLPKAAFDLGCPSEQLEVTQLTDDAESVGVRGCGRQARYEYVLSTGWVVDTTGEDSTAPN